MICFSCDPDLWATLFFIYLHKLSKVTPVLSRGQRFCQHLRVRGQATCPERGGYRRSPGTGEQVPVLCSRESLGFQKANGEKPWVCSINSAGPFPTFESEP